MSAAKSSERTRFARPAVGAAVLLGVAAAAVGTIRFVRSPGVSDANNVTAIDADPFPFPAPAFAPDVPPDVTIPAGFPPLPANTIQYFDDYSWRAFLAVTWSADAARRGVPDRVKTVLDDAGPRVWEHWKPMYEIFLGPEVTPGEWAAEQPTDNFCPASPPARRIAMSRRLVELNQAGMGANHPMGPLVASNRTYIQYEIRINQVAFEYIRSNKLYRRDAIGTAATAFPDGSIVVKAAWRELGRDDDPQRFFHVRAYVLDPVARGCVVKTMGLVALHIAQKTPSRPQWIWSTFEHVDALTDRGPFAILAPDPVGTPPAPPAPCQPSAVPPSGLVLTPPAVIEQSAPADPPPVAIARIIPIASCTAWTNHLYRTALADEARRAGRAAPASANYRLVATQWPTTPFDQFNLPHPLLRSNPFPLHYKPETNAANVLVETYVQTRNSCMNCHAAAKTHFIWFPELRALPSPTDGFRAIATRLRDTSGR